MSNALLGLFVVCGLIAIGVGVRLFGFRNKDSASASQDATDMPRKRTEVSPLFVKWVRDITNEFFMKFKFQQLNRADIARSVVWAAHADKVSGFLNDESRKGEFLSVWNQRLDARSLDAAWHLVSVWRAADMSCATSDPILIKGFINYLFDRADTTMSANAALVIYVMIYAICCVGKTDFEILEPSRMFIRMAESIPDDLDIVQKSTYA